MNVGCFSLFSMLCSHLHGTGQSILLCRNQSFQKVLTLLSILMHLNALPYLAITVTSRPRTVQELLLPWNKIHNQELFQCSILNEDTLWHCQALGELKSLHGCRLVWWVGYLHEVHMSQKLARGLVVTSAKELLCITSSAWLVGLWSGSSSPWWYWHFPVQILFRHCKRRGASYIQKVSHCYFLHSWLLLRTYLLQDIVGIYSVENQKLICYFKTARELYIWHIVALSFL